MCKMTDRDKLLRAIALSEDSFESIVDKYFEMYNSDFPLFRLKNLIDHIDLKYLEPLLVRADRALKSSMFD